MRGVAPSLFALLLVLTGSLAGARPAAAGPTGVVQGTYDPFEHANRGLFAFGGGLDRLVIGPITHAYLRVAPAFLRDRVSAVVYNLGEPSTAANDLLQAHAKRAARAGSRFAINSTIGLLGMFDVASGVGVAAHEADFGQTLGRYGLQAGPYVFVPVLGPSSVRDGVGRLVDFVADPVALVAGGNFKTTFNASRVGGTLLDTRANADGALKALDDATDPYATARSAYTQHREAFVRQTTGGVETLPDFDTPGAQ